MQTTGNTILITGGTSGIGLAFAEEFYKLGNTVIICGRRQDRLDTLSKKHPGMITRPFDVENPADRIALAEWAMKQYPGLNIFMNNAGVQYAFNMMQKMDLKKVQTEVETNFTAYVHFANLFAPFLAAKQNTAIINISSGLAFVPMAFMPVYCATKAAVHSFTLSLRHQLKDTGIRVFEIAPPSVDTELGHDRRPDKTQTHGGIPVQEFLSEAMEAIANDNLEALIGNAKNLRHQNEQLFARMNH